MTLTGDILPALRDAERMLRRAVERPARDCYEQDYRRDDVEAALRTVQGLAADLLSDGIEAARLELCAGCDRLRADVADGLCEPCRARDEASRAAADEAADARYEAVVQGDVARPEWWPRQGGARDAGGSAQGARPVPVG